MTSFLAFDVLSVDGREVMAEPWTDRRKRLEDIGRGLDSKRIAVVPVTDDAVKWGDWGWAAKVRLAYTHPRTGALTTIDELVRVSDPEGWELRLSEADVLCWGVLPSGRLRHPVVVR